MKKITIVLAATLLGVCLSGCGKNTKQDNTETGIIEDVNASDEIETSEDLDVSNTDCLLKL